MPIGLVEACRAEVLCRDLEDLADLGRVFDALRDDERGDGGGVRCRHARAAPGPPTPGGLLQDALARGRDVERGPLVAVAGHSLPGVRGADADHLVVLRRVVEGAAPAAVAGGRDDDHTGFVGVDHRVVDRGAPASAAQAHVDDVGAVVSGPADALCDVVVAAPAGVPKDLDRHQLRPGGQPRHAVAVVRRLGDGAGDVGAMAHGVAVLIAVVDGVVAVDEILDAVLSGRRGPGVEDRDHRAGSHPPKIPCVAGPDLFEAPLLVEPGVVGDCRRLRDVVRLREDQDPLLLQAGDGGGDLFDSDVQAHQAERGLLFHDLVAGAVQHALRVPGVVQADEDLALDVGEVEDLEVVLRGAGRHQQQSSGHETSNLVVAPGPVYKLYTPP